MQIFIFEFIAGGGMLREEAPEGSLLREGAAMLKAAVADFARLLQSAGNRIGKDAPGDAERAYRLSLRLRPDRNLAHAGLALLLDQTGRAGEAAREAALALGVLDDYAQVAGQGPAPAEDIWPFRSPVELRAKLEALTKGAS